MRYSPGSRQREREIGRVNFEGVAARQNPQMNFDRPLCELNLRGAIVEREE